MKFLYSVGREEEFVRCPVCGRSDFGYDYINYPEAHLKCTACGAITVFKKAIRELKVVDDNGRIQSK